MRESMSKRIDDMRDLLRSEVRTAAAEILGKLDRLEQRIERLGGERRVVRPQ
jgi:hypothetical protein